jgi:AraC-like DNA-binding protein
LPLPRQAVDRALGLQISGREGIGALLTQFLVRISADTQHYQPADGPRLGTVLVDLVASLLAHTLDTESSLTPESRTRALTLRVKAFIQQNLHDPDLTPSRIAAAHHISRSYLHRIFKTESDTVAAYVRGRRLEGARHDLTDPGLASTPIHVVATRWGFPQAADFSRAFHTAYGLSPSEHRRRATQP